MKSFYVYMPLLKANNFYQLLTKIYTHRKIYAAVNSVR